MNRRRFLRSLAAAAVATAAATAAVAALAREPVAATGIDADAIMARNAAYLESVTDPATGMTFVFRNWVFDEFDAAVAMHGDPLDHHVLETLRANG